MKEAQQCRLNVTMEEHIVSISWEGNVLGQISAEEARGVANRLYLAAAAADSQAQRAAARSAKQALKVIREDREFLGKLVRIGRRQHPTRDVEMENLGEDRYILRGGLRPLGHLLGMSYMTVKRRLDRLSGNSSVRLLSKGSRLAPSVYLIEKSPTSSEFRC
jgi:hypothetical protein